MRNVLRLSPRRRAARNWFPRVAPSASDSSGRSTSEMTRSYMPSGGSRSPWAANIACRWRSTASVRVMSLEAWPSAATSGSGAEDGVGQLGLDRLEIDDLFGVERRKAADQVLELAHVARPAMLAAGASWPRATGPWSAGRRRSRRAGSGWPARECRRAARAAAAGGSARRSGGRTDPRGTGPAGSARRRSRWVAATMRTLALIGVRPPTVMYSPSCSTRSRRVCASGGMSPISSRNSVPPSACSNLPDERCTAPVKAPRSWPNSSLSISSRGIAAS